MPADDFLCGISAGIGIDCTGKGQIGGLNRRVFVGNIKDLANLAYTTDAEGYTTAINFKPYGLLYEFVGQKYAHTSTDDVARNEGGSVNYPHTVTLKLFDSTPDDKAVIESMTAADVFVVVETNNQTFEIFGYQNGLTLDTAPKESGQAASADTSRTLTLSGAEVGLAKVFLDTDYATSITTLESYVG